MKTGAILLIAGGAVLIYWVLRSGLSSEQSSSASSSPSGDGSAASNSSSNSSSDSGQHQGIDITGTETGTVGAVYTIMNTYASMTDQQKDDANAFAHVSG